MDWLSSIGSDEDELDLDDVCTSLLIAECREDKRDAEDEPGVVFEKLRRVGEVEDPEAEDANVDEVDDDEDDKNDFSNTGWLVFTPNVWIPFTTSAWLLTRIELLELLNSKLSKLLGNGYKTRESAAILPKDGHASIILVINRCES